PAARHPRDGQRPANNLPIRGFLGVWAKKTPAMVVCWRESTAGVQEVGEGQRGWCRRCTGGIRVTTEGGQRLSPEPPAKTGNCFGVSLPRRFSPKPPAVPAEPAGVVKLTPWVTRLRIAVCARAAGHARAAGKTRFSFLRGLRVGFPGTAGGVGNVD